MLSDLIVRRLQTAAIRSMTGRILEEAPPEGNLRIMSTYVMAFCGVGAAHAIAVVATQHALHTPACLSQAHFRATLNEISSRCRFQGGLRIFRLPALPVPQVP